MIELFSDDIFIGLEIEDVLCISGSPLCVQNLQDSFNRPPKYGRDIDWSGYTVYDAASTMLRFLARLPEPVIPLERYEVFVKPLRQNFLDWKRTTEFPTSSPWSGMNESIIEEYRWQIISLPWVSSNLLLYLLDIFAVIASHSESNKMTSWRIAKVFRQVILSPVKAGGYYTEDDPFSGLSQYVLTFLIQHRNFFCFNWSDKDSLPAMSTPVQTARL